MLIWNRIRFFVLLIVFSSKTAGKDANYVLERTREGLLEYFYYSGEFISSGRYSYVYRFRYGVLEGRVAIKIPRKSKYSFSLRNEIAFLNMIKHENIAPINAYFTVKKRICVVMPFYENNLHAYICSLERLDVKKKNILKQIIDALAYLHHNNIIHNDIKLDNILIDKNQHIVLSDFGLSCNTGKDRALFPPDSFEKSTNKYYHYSPEIRKNKEYGVKTDMWSFGCLFFSMYTGMNLNKDTVVSKCLNYDNYRFFVYFHQETSKLRLSSYSARFSDFFNEIYDFAFCFCKLKDFDIKNKDYHCKKVESRFSMIMNPKRITIYCKCNRISKKLFNAKKKKIISQDSYWFSEEQTNKFEFSFASHFAVSTASKRCLLPELLHSEYRTISKIFTFLNQKKCSKEPKVELEAIENPNKRKKCEVNNRISKKVKSN